MELQAYIKYLTDWGKATNAVSCGGKFRAANPDLTLCKVHHVLAERQPLGKPTDYLDTKDTGRCGCLSGSDITSTLPRYENLSMDQLQERWLATRDALFRVNPHHVSAWEAATLTERKAWLAYDMQAFILAERIRNLMKYEPKDVREPADWNNPDDMKEEIVELQYPLFAFMGDKKLRTGLESSCETYCKEHDDYGEGYPVRHACGYQACMLCTRIEPQTALEVEMMIKRNEHRDEAEITIQPHMVRDRR